MSQRIALLMSALVLAAGAAGAASAADAKKATHIAHPRSQASLQCSAEANAKGLHGKARSAFRHSCLHQASAAHKAIEHKKIAEHKMAAKKVHRVVTHKKVEKPEKKT